MKQNNNLIHKQLLLLCLYIAQSIPMSFFSSVVPVIMRENHYSLESIGLLQLIKLPWILKLFWAPLVDDKTTVFTDYKRWIIFSELFYAVVIITIGFLNLETNFHLIIILMIIAITASSTQDIATDALSIYLIKGQERSLGASMQSMGSFIGTLVGSGVLLVIYHYFGWKSLLIGLSVFVMVALTPLLTYKQTNHPKTPVKKKISLRELLTFFRQRNIAKQIIFLLLYYAGITSILAMFRPFLVDLGYPMKEIGFLFGILGTSAATICSFGAGFLIRRAGKDRCRVLFALFTVLATGFVLWLSFGHTSKMFVYSGVISLWIAYGLATVVVFTTAMDLTREGCEGTDFTLQTVFTHLSGIILAIISGQIAGKFSYTALFIFSVGLALVSLIYNIYFYQPFVPKNNDTAPASEI